MKKLFNLVVMLCIMSFAGNNLFAQNDNTDLGSDHELISANSTDESSESAPGGQALTLNDLQAVLSLLKNTSSGVKRPDNVLNDTTAFFVPISKKNIDRGHYITQRLELSALFGKDRDPNENETKASAKASSGNTSSTELLKDLPQIGEGFNYGMNFGYSLIFVPGYKQNDKLLLNRLGFAYSVGVICQFDNEKDYGITCDFLGKVGFETGFNKKIGVGVDFLGGGGKTNGYLFAFDPEDKNLDEEDLTYTYTAWCGKVGTQLWIRLNFLTSSVKNFDVAVFTRFVYSFNPYGDIEYEMEAAGISNYFKEESWQFGLTMSYRL